MDTKEIMEKESRLMYAQVTVLAGNDVLFDGVYGYMDGSDACSFFQNIKDDLRAGLAVELFKIGADICFAEYIDTLVALIPLKASNGFPFVLTVNKGFDAVRDDELYYHGEFAEIEGISPHCEVIMEDMYRHVPECHEGLNVDGENIHPANADKEPEEDFDGQTVMPQIPGATQSV